MTNDRPDPSSEGAPDFKNTQLSNSTKHLVMSRRWGSTPRLTDLLTVGRNVTLTQNIMQCSQRCLRGATPKMQFSFLLHTRSWPTLKLHVCMHTCVQINCNLYL
jgi:hypothetical protein